MTQRHFILIFIILLSLKGNSQHDIVKVGQQIPSFDILLENGQTISSTSLNGKVVLINFFATWCAPCLAELPILEEKVWKKYKSNPNFRLLVIGRDQSEPIIQTFKAKHNFDLPMYPDKSKIIYSLFATQYIPRNYIIDKTGKVIYSSISYTPEEFDKMINVLDTLLK